MAKESFCLLKYFDNDTGCTPKSDSLKYSDKHQHGTQPTDEQLESLLPSLIEAVNKLREKYSLKYVEKPTLERITLTISQCEVETWTRV